MEKLAFIFPGQGSQFIGMGKSFFKSYKIAMRTFEEANEALGFDLTKLCFEGSLTELNKMENMFPAILTSSVVLFRIYMEEIGVLPQFCAGHSLGEFSALTCSGVVKFSDALKIVRERGRLAQEVVNSKKSGMTIIDNIDKDSMKQLCKKISKTDNAYISCYNAPGQIAISGLEEVVFQIEDEAINLDGNITPIIGSAPFHSPLMGAIAEELRSELEKYSYSDARYPIISNVTGKLYQNSDKSTVIDLLIAQILKPVQWQATMQYFKKYGITTIIEMSPKNVLSNLVEANESSIKTFCFGLREDRKTLIESESIVSLKKHVPNLITRCMTAVVATPNLNWSNDEYKKGVVENYAKFKEIKEKLEEEKKDPSIYEMREALELLLKIFETKKVSKKEQSEWFNQILEETGLMYTFPEFMG